MSPSHSSFGPARKLVADSVLLIGDDAEVVVHRWAALSGGRLSVLLGFGRSDRPWDVDLDRSRCR